jgi:transposase-like protein
MQLIQEAIEYLESREAGDNFSYREVAKKFGVNRVTLMRRHKHETEEYGVRNQSLPPECEAELVQYIETLTERRLPPTRTMIQQFAS